jgi:opacity protein-like surface antigen
MKKSFVSAAAAAAFLAASASAAIADDHATDSASAGYLRCDVEGSVSFIFGSTRNLTCKFEPAGGEVQHYTGEIERYGIDIGYLESAVMIWGVVTAGEDLPKDGLAGKYAGVSAEIAAGYGVGANALILGEESIALQPLSVQGGEGLNIAAGVAQLTLKQVQ